MWFILNLETSWSSHYSKALAEFSKLGDVVQNGRKKQEFFLNLSKQALEPFSRDGSMISCQELYCTALVFSYICNISWIHGNLDHIGGNEEIFAGPGTFNQTRLLFQNSPSISIQTAPSQLGVPC